MKLKFKHQAYQADSVQAVIDCFKGQLPDEAARRYRIDLVHLLKVAQAQQPMLKLGSKTPIFS